MIKNQLAMTLRESYATATFETGPVWDVSLVITNVPKGDRRHSGFY